MSKTHKNINDVDINNWTLLHYICRFGTIQQFKKIIIMDGIDIEAKTRNNYRAIHFACSGKTNMYNHDQFEAIYTLIRMNVMLEVEMNESLPLWDVIQRKKPIHFICSQTYMYSDIQYEAIKLLIANGVNYKCMDDFRWRPTDYIRSERNNMDDEKLKLYFMYDLHMNYVSHMRYET